MTRIFYSSHTSAALVCLTSSASPSGLKGHCFQTQSPCMALCLWHFPTLRNHTPCHAGISWRSWLCSTPQAGGLCRSLLQSVNLLGGSWAGDWKKRIKAVHGCNHLGGSICSLRYSPQPRHLVTEIACKDIRDIQSSSFLASAPFAFAFRFSGTAFRSLVMPAMMLLIGSVPCPYFLPAPLPVLIL